MSDFDVILGMDFLSQYGTEIDNKKKKKKVQFHLDYGKEFSFRKCHVLSIMINSVKVRKLFSKRCKGYLAHVVSKVNNSLLSL